MPQLILLGLIAVGGYFAWKAIKREMARVDEKVRKAKMEREGKPTETLEYDEETGKYRPKDEESG
ncbi:MAG TPA: hypothetical protein VLA28_08290 [Afifellaceae bacterium]|nr:hypothetical protein [Afifellaceae bacterium]